MTKVADGTTNSPYFFSNPETPNFEYASSSGCHSGEANIKMDNKNKSPMNKGFSKALSNLYIKLRLIINYYSIFLNNI